MKTYQKIKPFPALDEFVLQIDDGQGNILNIPADVQNRHYRKALEEIFNGEAEIAEDS